jgi:hypothetical protein
LVILCSGVSTGPDAGVTCDKADNIGLETQQSWDEEKYGDVTLYTASRVNMLTTMHYQNKLNDGNNSMDAN